MKKYLLSGMFALSILVFGAANSFSAEPTASTVSGTNAISPAIADLNALVTRINAKIQQDKKSEADLADEIKQFDALSEKYKDASVDDRSEILQSKLTLYVQVLSEPDKALAVAKQFKAQFPTKEINGNTDDLINALQKMVEQKNIQDALAPGTPFPDFQETDVNGNPLSISKYKGKVVLVDFWATWCMPCVVKLPEIQKAYDKFHDQGFEVVGVSLDVEKDKLQQFVKQRKMPWPQFFDGKRWDNKLAVKYGVDQTPTGYLLGRDGKIIKKLGVDDDLNAEVALALKK
jgi:peroxiredoxin